MNLCMYLYYILDFLRAWFLPIKWWHTNILIWLMFVCHLLIGKNHVLRMWRIQLIHKTRKRTYDCCLKHYYLFQVTIVSPFPGLSMNHCCDSFSMFILISCLYLTTFMKISLFHNNGDWDLIPYFFFSDFSIIWNYMIIWNF